MAKKLYIGNLAYGVTVDALRDLFATVGEVATVTIITDRMTNQSKGFGFVEMVTDEGATAAINNLNGKDFESRQITVAEARPPRDNRDRGGFGGDRRGGSGGSGGGGGSGGRGKRF